MIEVETLPSAIRFTIPQGEVDPARLEAVLRWLELESISECSQMTEEEADAMADEMKANWWAANKARFIPASLIGG